ncbi:hypothetical protein, partial [uncultured Bilophila sp.]|uniref:hypothetical protein n=1 Tax=uncultured Bilophila sp. TaxID=529385 RepID=UPI00259395DA
MIKSFTVAPLENIGENGTEEPNSLYPARQSLLKAQIIRTPSNRDSINTKVFGRGGMGAGGREEKVFLQKSFSSLPPVLPLQQP